MSLNQSAHVSVDICMGHDGEVDGTHHLDPRFSITQERLAEIVEMNDAVYLEQNGGIQGIAAALCSNIDTGIIGDERDICCRRRVFGFNNNCWKLLDDNDHPSGKRFHELVSESFFKDSTIVLLLCCAVLSLLIGIKTNGPQQGLVDGAIVFLTILVVVNFGLMSRFFKTRLLLIMMKMKKRRVVVSVIRHGKVQVIPASELVVGDVVLLEARNQVPADGLFIHGDSSSSSFKLDDDGDGDGDGLVEIGEGMFKNVSVFSGSKVVEGNFRMLVTAVGTNTERSKLILTRKNRGQELKLQAAIDKMNRRLENLWLILSLLILSMQGVRCFMQKYNNSASDDDVESRPQDPNKGLKNTVEEILNEYSSTRMKKAGGRVNHGLVSVLCILLLANRDGLPLGILALCFCSSRKMKSFGAKVQKLPACLSVGLVTSIICLGKTSSLSTLRQTDKVELWIGGLTRVMDVTKEVRSHHLLKILREGICLQELIINKDWLVSWIKQVFGGLIDTCPPANILYNDLSNCCMSILARDDDKENQLAQMLHWRGAPDLILSLCSHYYDVDGTMQILDPEKRQDFSRLFNDLNNISGSDSTNGTLLAFACKKIKTHQQLQASNNNNNNNNQSYEQEQYEHNNVRSRIDEKELLVIDSISRGFTLVALVRLKSATPHAAEAMKALNCFRALGINVKLVVGEDLKAARIMLMNSPAGGNGGEANIMEASHFRNSSVETCMKMLKNVDVIANAFPADKLLIVQCLRKKGDDEVVGLISRSFNRRDTPSLLEADVGISMMNGDGQEAVVVEEEAADIMILGQDVGASVASIIKEGRYLCKRIQAFLQLHFVLNLTAFALNFVLEILKNEAQLTPYHLLWTNLIVETLGAVALSIAWVDRHPGVLNNGTIPPPFTEGYNINNGGGIITKIMWRNIATQSLFQVTVLVSLAMKGKYILEVDDNVLSTMIFNCYVLFQVFALIGIIIQRTSCGTTTSSSSDHDHDHVGRLKIKENYLFSIACLMIMVGLQVLLVEIMGFLFHWEKLDYKKWFICIGIAAVSVPVGCVVEWVSHVMMMMMMMI